MKPGVCPPIFLPYGLVRSGGMTGRAKLPLFLISDNNRFSILPFRPAVPHAGERDKRRGEMKQQYELYN